jgi:hypothetical protein
MISTRIIRQEVMAQKRTQSEGGRGRTRASPIGMWEEVPSRYTCKLPKRAALHCQRGTRASVRSESDNARHSAHPIHRSDGKLQEIEETGERVILDRTITLSEQNTRTCTD